jgi:hypothetical protein
MVTITVKRGSKEITVKIPTSEKMMMGMVTDGIGAAVVKMVKDFSEEIRKP